MDCEHREGQSCKRGEIGAEELTLSDGKLSLFLFTFSIELETGSEPMNEKNREEIEVRELPDDRQSQRFAVDHSEGASEDCQLCFPEL